MNLTRMNFKEYKKCVDRILKQNNLKKDEDYDNILMYDRILNGFMHGINPMKIISTIHKKEIN